MAWFLALACLALRALMQVHSVLEPTKQHIVMVEREQAQHSREDDGAPP
jgi:hypothetical protein